MGNFAADKLVVNLSTLQQASKILNQIMIQLYKCILIRRFKNVKWRHLATSYAGFLPVVVVAGVVVIVAGSVKATIGAVKTNACDNNIH